MPSQVLAKELFFMRRKVYVLEVDLVEGLLDDEFFEENPKIARVIEIQGHHTLQQLHKVIFTAFEREEERHYEFLLEEETESFKTRFVSEELEDDEEDVGRVENATIQELKLQVGDVFEYIFDDEEMWIHQIRVEAILPEEKENVRYPRVTKKIGQSPPQYAEV